MFFFWEKLGAWYLPLTRIWWDLKTLGGASSWWKHFDFPYLLKSISNTVKRKKRTLSKGNALINNVLWELSTLHIMFFGKALFLAQEFLILFMLVILLCFNHLVFLFCLKTISTNSLTWPWLIWFRSRIVRFKIKPFWFSGVWKKGNTLANFWH